MAEDIGSAGRAAGRLSQERVGSLTAMLERGGRADWSRLAEALGGPSEPLAEPVRQRMEGLLGHDLGEARLHRSGQVESLAQHLGAEAFTIGTRVFAPARSVEPLSERGAGLLAHELTHVVQQSAPRPIPGRSGGLPVSAGPSSHPTLQRSSQGEEGIPVNQTGEAEAMGVEHAVGRSSGPSGRRAPVDVEALAERVFRLMKEDLALERERQGRGWRAIGEVF